MNKSIFIPFVSVIIMTSCGSHGVQDVQDISGTWSWAHAKLLDGMGLMSDMNIEYEFLPETEVQAGNNMSISADGSVKALGAGTLDVTLFMPGTYSLENGTLSVTLDPEKFNLDFNMRSKGLIGDFASTAIDSIKEHVTEEIKEGLSVGGTIEYTIVKAEDNKLVLKQNGGDRTVLKRRNQATRQSIRN